MKARIGIVMLTLCCFVCFPTLDAFAHSHGGGGGHGGGKGGGDSKNSGFENSMSQNDLIFVFDNNWTPDTSSAPATPLWMPGDPITIEDKIRTYQMILTGTQFFHEWVGWGARVGLSFMGGALPIQIGIAMLDKVTNTYSKNPDASPEEMAYQAVEGGALTYVGGKAGEHFFNDDIVDATLQAFGSTATGEFIGFGFSKIKEDMLRNAQPSRVPEYINNRGFDSHMQHPGATTNIMGDSHLAR